MLWLNIFVCLDEFEIWNDNGLERLQAYVIPVIIEQ